MHSTSTELQVAICHYMYITRTCYDTAGSMYGGNNGSMLGGYGASTYAGEPSAYQYPEAWQQVTGSSMFSYFEGSCCHNLPSNDSDSF